MRHRRTAALALMVVACESGASGPSTCTLEDTGSPCAQGTVATPLEGGGWRVILRVSVTDAIAYEDDGVVCVRHNQRCVQSECYFYGGSMTQQEAIAACRAS